MENGKIVIYRTADGETSIDVKLENDTVWLTQAQMAELFQKDQMSKNPPPCCRSVSSECGQLY